MPIVLKSESLNLLDPSGPVQACNGIALSFTPMYQVYCYHLSNAWVVTETEYGLLGKTALRDLMGKIGVRERGRLYTLIKLFYSA
jgi:hypothetical protein